MDLLATALGRVVPKRVAGGGDRGKARFPTRVPSRDEIPPEPEKPTPPSTPEPAVAEKPVVPEKPTVEAAPAISEDELADLEAASMDALEPGKKKKPESGGADEEKKEEKKDPSTEKEPSRRPVPITPKEEAGP